MEIEGRRVEINSAQDAIAAGMALAPEDRKADGVVLELNVAHNTTLSCLRRIERFGLLQMSRERELVENYVNRLRVKTPSIHQRVGNLSGGQSTESRTARGRYSGCS